MLTVFFKRVTQGGKHIRRKTAIHAGSGRHPGDGDDGGELPAGTAAFGAVSAGGGYRHKFREYFPAKDIA